MYNSARHVFDFLKKEVCRSTQFLKWVVIEQCVIKRKGDQLCPAVVL